jgi:dihydroorotate dehydrogenase (NAD+) catalytic subunit
MNLKIKIGKLKLDNPIICASGTFGLGQELKGLVNYKKIGAVIAKTITLLPRVGNPPPRIFETECGVLNSVGLENPGVKDFIESKLEELEKIGTKFIVSVGGGSPQEYEKMVRKISKEKSIEAIEINLSCPNIKNKKIVSQSAMETFKLVNKLRKITNKTLIAKITPEVSDITAVARAVEDAGVDSVSLVNTFFAMAINIETQAPYLGNVYGGYSGKAIKPLSLYRVWRVAKEVKIPIIGGGGIETAQDAVEFILAGATAVSLGTINLVYPNVAEEILKGIERYMKDKKISDINKLRGKIKE